MSVEWQRVWAVVRDWFAMGQVLRRRCAVWTTPRPPSPEEPGARTWKHRTSEVSDMGGETERRLWPLLLIAAGGPEATLDPVRIMKGIFLLTEQLASHDITKPLAYPVDSARYNM